MYFRTLISTLLLVPILGGCGDDGGSTTPTTTATAAPTTATTPATAAPTIAATPTTVASSGEREEARVAQDGDTVAVHYTGTLDDGSQFDSSAGRDPLTFVVGSGEVISGFDDAVRGLAEGESRTVRIEPANAYGEVDPELILEFPADQAPEGVAVGDQVTLSNGGAATVLEITDDIIRIDANHRLAGEALTFDVELVAIG